MTRRARLAKLEARREEGQGDAIGIFEADVSAGLWREMNGTRTLPLSPDALQEAGARAQTGGGLLMIAPVYPAKVIAGVSWADL